LPRTQLTVEFFNAPWRIHNTDPVPVQAFDLNLFGNGAVLGCDFAGKVERLGKDVTKIAEGDTIAGLIWGGKSAA
jgi:D-arabinose 1-dehydrogenase-like Zn-dependent alcohol dehydrogenase